MVPHIVVYCKHRPLRTERIPNIFLNIDNVNFKNNAHFIDLFRQDILIYDKLLHNREAPTKIGPRTSTF